MRKLIFQMVISLDGYFEGPNHEIDWHNVDAEFNDYAIDLLNKLDILIFGRKTYELMASYWPSPDALKNDPIVAGKMNSLAKIVYSKSLKNAGWNNTRLIQTGLEEEIMKLKNQTGKDIAIFGSSDLTVTLMNKNLIDEYRIFMAPVVIGHGKPLFQGLNKRMKLKLINSKQFKSGNMLLTYSE